eukprot:3115600-Pleurochrysis_carterae.AAC.1
MFFRRKWNSSVLDDESHDIVIVRVHGSKSALCPCVEKELAVPVTIVEVREGRRHRVHHVFVPKEATCYFVRVCPCLCASGPVLSLCGRGHAV